MRRLSASSRWIPQDASPLAHRQLLVKSPPASTGSGSSSPAATAISTASARDDAPSFPYRDWI